MNLGSRYWRFSRKAYWLAAAFAQAARPPLDVNCTDAHVLTRENATVYLQEQWSAFCRDPVCSSWRGGVWTLGGTYVQARSGSRTNGAALAALRATYTGKQKKAKHWEPKWFDPLETIEAARRLTVPNFSNIAAGVGLTPSPLDELRAVRNYFAHRGRESSSRLATYVGGQVTDASAHALISDTTLGGGYRFELWAAELDSMARAATL